MKINPKAHIEAAEIVEKTVNMSKIIDLECGILWLKHKTFDDHELIVLSATS